MQKTEQNNLSGTFVFTNETASIRDFLQVKRASNLSQHTVVTYEYHLKQLWQWLQVNRIAVLTESDVVDYFVFLRSKGYAPSTMRDKWTAINAYLRFCGRGQLLKRIRKPKASEQARCFTDDEIQRIMSSFNDTNTFTALRDYTIVCILLATGLRKSELLSMRKENSDSDYLISDYLTVTGKGNKKRYVPLSPSLKRVLRRYLDARERIATNTDALLVTKSGLPLTSGGLRAVFVRLQARTGIAGKRFSPHTLRHSFATMYLRNGGTLPSLQRILGHSDLATTSIYLNWSDNFVKQENDACCPLDKLIL